MLFIRVYFWRFIKRWYIKGFEKFFRKEICLILFNLDFLDLFKFRFFFCDIFVYILGSYFLWNILFYIYFKVYFIFY